MIQPEAYYAAHKECETPEELGRIGFILVGRGDELTPPPSSIERSFAKSIMRCNKWHSEKREELQEKWRTRQKSHRDKGVSPDVTVTSRDKEVSRTSTDLPISLSTSLSNTSTIRTDTDTGSGRVERLDVYGMADEELCSGMHSTLDLYANACGKGFWAKAIRQLGEAAMLEELVAFIHEVRAGEDVANPGAVMTARLKARMEAR